MVSSKSIEIQSPEGCWKGSSGNLKILDSTQHTVDSTCSNSSGSDSSSSRSLAISEEWLGGEVNLLDVEIEKKGIADILDKLTEEEKTQMMAFDRTMPIRHFRAEKGNTSKAIAQIKETLRWREEFGVDIITSCFQVEGTDRDTMEHARMRKILSEENQPGKIYVRGYDQHGRALMYMTPALENTNNELNNMRHLVFNLEKAIACTKHRSKNKGQNGQPFQKINLLIDYENFKLKMAPPMSTTRYTLDILQKHYPECMFHAYLLHPPTVFTMFWSLIKHFVDPVTKSKIVFCTGKHGASKLTDHVTDRHKLEPRSYGSECRTFDSQEYLHLPFHISFDEDP